MNGHSNNHRHNQIQKMNQNYNNPPQIYHHFDWNGHQNSNGGPPQSHFPVYAANSSPHFVEPSSSSSSSSAAAWHQMSQSTLMKMPTELNGNGILKKKQNQNMMNGHSTHSQPTKLKLVMVGIGGVGKSSLTVQVGGQKYSF
jgi:hypothetical protein